MRLIGTAEVPDGGAKVVRLGELEVAVFRLGGRFYALENECLHRGGPLGEGELRGETVICPWHGWKYNVPTGSLELIPTLKVGSYKIELRGEEVFMEVPVVASEKKRK